MLFPISYAFSLDLVAPSVICPGCWATIGGVILVTRPFSWSIPMNRGYSWPASLASLCRAIVRAWLK